MEVFFYLPNDGDGLMCGGGRGEGEGGGHLQVKLATSCAHFWLVAQTCDKIQGAVRIV